MSDYNITSTIDKDITLYCDDGIRSPPLSQVLATVTNIFDPVHAEVFSDIYGSIIFWLEASSSYDN